MVSQAPANTSCGQGIKPAPLPVPTQIKPSLSFAMHNTSLEGKLPFPTPALNNFHLSSAVLSIEPPSLKTIKPPPFGDTIHFWSRSSTTSCATSFSGNEKGVVNDCQLPSLFKT